MHCPRCGTPSEPGDRYCAACGERLQRAKAPDRPDDGAPGQSGLSRLFGADRKSKLVSAITLVAVIVAVIAFFAIPASDDSIPRDRYTLAAERICLQAKQRIVAAGREGGSAYARQLVPIAVGWREELGELNPPSDRLEQVEDLDRALREVEIEAAVLARISEEGNRARTVASAKRTDLASAAAEEAIAELGLSECAGATLGFLPTK